MRTHMSVSLTLLAMALAACSGPPRDHGNMPGGSDMPRESARSMISCQSVTAPLQTQLQETAMALMLTPRQVVLWNSYQESVSALMADQMKTSLYQSTARSALAQIQARIDTASNRLAALEQIADQARILYQSLDASQQKIADQRLAGTLPALHTGLDCQNRTDADRETRRDTSPGGRPGPGMGGGMGRF